MVPDPLQSNTVKEVNPMQISYISSKYSEYFGNFILYRVIGELTFHSPEGSLLCNSVHGSAGGGCDVGTVSVAICVLAVSDGVDSPFGTASKVVVFKVDAPAKEFSSKCS